MLGGRTGVDCNTRAFSFFAAAIFRRRRRRRLSSFHCVTADAAAAAVAVVRRHHVLHNAVPSKSHLRLVCAVTAASASCDTHTQSRR